MGLRFPFSFCRISIFECITGGQEFFETTGLKYETGLNEDCIPEATMACVSENRKG